MTGFITNGWSRGRVISSKVSTVQLDATANTTLASIPGLSHKLFSNTKYVIRGHISCTAGASGGVKFALVGQGGLVATQFSLTVINMNGTTVNANATTTTLGTALGATAAATDLMIYGTITTGSVGNALLAVQFAQNASNGTVSSALIGSDMTFTPVV